MGQQRKYGLLRNCSRTETMHHPKLSAVTEKLQSHVDTFQQRALKSFSHFNRVVQKASRPNPLSLF